jgi:hypothetical protein
MAKVYRSSFLNAENYTHHLSKLFVAELMLRESKKGLNFLKNTANSLFNVKI